jgi:hypothetical protein
MNTRRKFLLQGSIATTALLVTKPFNTFAKITSPVTGLKNNNNSILFLHTGTVSVSQTAAQVTALKSNYANVMLLHAGTTVPVNLQQLKYDASVESTTNVVFSNAYKIVYKGDFKTGVINADAAAAGTVQELNTLATFLKKEKRCNVVICISALGYRNKKGMDDIQLAAASQNIDMIIGAHAENFSSLPAIALNKNNEEVIIDHAANTDAQVGKVAISFNSKGQKNHIAF